MTDSKSITDMVKARVDQLRDAEPARIRELVRTGNKREALEAARARQHARHTTAEEKQAAADREREAERKAAPITSDDEIVLVDNLIRAGLGESEAEAIVKARRE